MKPNFTLPFVVLTAWLVAQSEVSAGPVSFPSAVVIPSARGSIDLTICDENQFYCKGGVNTPILFPPNQSSQTVKDGASSATGTMTSTPSPSISASMYATASSTAELLFAYYFGFAVRPGLTLIGAHITFAASGKASGSGDFTASASVQVQRAGARLGEMFSYYACTAPCADGLPAQSSFSASKNLQVYGNTLYSVVMTVDLTADGVNGTTGAAKALGSIDPIITIDPQYASDFQLLLSPYVGNAAYRRQKLPF